LISALGTERGYFVSSYLTKSGASSAAK